MGGALDHIARPVCDAVNRSGRKVAYAGVAACIAVVAILFLNTLRLSSRQLIVAPLAGLMIGATDSRHMVALADDVYRFSPVRARAEDLPRFHGTDERISVANYVDLIRFYQTLIGHAAGGTAAR